MKNVFMLGLFLILSFSAHAKNKAKKSCEELVPASDGTTNGDASEAYEIQSCYEERMNKALDKRLLKLKKHNKELFKKEMKLQAIFKKAYVEACITVNSCDGSMYRVSLGRCLSAMTKWRYEQALLINNQNLFFEPAVFYGEPKDRNQFKDIIAINEFARELCDMPKEIFKNEKPKNCEALVKEKFLEIAGDSCHLVG